MIWKFWTSTDPEYAAQQKAMLISLAVGIGLFGLKLSAYLLTGSAAILSDVAESVVHLPAVGIAAYCLWLSQRPPDRKHPYGYERVTYFSAGLEGALIIFAALYIFYESIHRLIAGGEIESITTGNLLIALCGILNGFLGWYLIDTGKKQNSLILVADGKHVLSDSYTSVGIVVGLGLVALTGYSFLDPLIALAIAVNILFAGWHLVREAILGLMEKVDPEVEITIRRILLEAEKQHRCYFHELRIRNTGRTTWMEMHMLFPEDVTIRQAHQQATQVEQSIHQELGRRVVITTHMEPWETHEEEHETFPDHPGHHH
ncbi:cation diffusion facilitator family transporter [bacterium]|nr:MAG: Cadmium, cobalt and zinc/H(+)-K(+) antiporter [Candidatus Hinthialibacteria bacterium OLB16]MCK6496262.1 cation diffusion facilitator family transporter [bacterium]NUP93453.1 cation transporter [Candidatus Omnitrophota bacterium]